MICKICKKNKPAFETGIILSNGALQRIDENGLRWSGKTCNRCSKLRRGRYLKSVKNGPARKYEKTKNGFLMRVYRNMLSRVSGVQSKKYHLYAGLSIISRDNFYEWSKNELSFHVLFKKWEESGYERKLTPSIDRINAYAGYEIGNMRWVTFSFNCRNVQR